MGLNVGGTKYFWYRHTDADTVDKLDPNEVALCVATAHVVADMPERPPRYGGCVAAPRALSFPVPETVAPAQEENRVPRL